MGFLAGNYQTLYQRAGPFHKVGTQKYQQTRALSVGACADDEPEADGGLA